MSAARICVRAVLHNKTEGYIASKYGKNSKRAPV